MYVKASTKLKFKQFLFMLLLAEDYKGVGIKNDIQQKLLYLTLVNKKYYVLYYYTFL